MSGVSSCGRQGAREGQAQAGGNRDFRGPFPESALAVVAGAPLRSLSYATPQGRGRGPGHSRAPGITLSPTRSPDHVPFAHSRVEQLLLGPLEAKESHCRFSVGSCPRGRLRPSRARASLTPTHLGGGQLPGVTASEG